MRGQPSPLEAGRRLDEALAQLQLEPDAGQRRQLLAHLALLAKWNAVYNLTALRDPDQMLTQHLFDCLAVLPVLRDPARAGRDHLADGAVVLDVGSGGGLPGVVLAICAPGVQAPVSYTHLRAHETVLDLVRRLLLAKTTHTHTQQHETTAL